MSYKFKSIADVDVVNTLTDKANVLIEENGAIKRVSKDEIGGGIKVASTAEVGQTIVVKAVDENGNPTEWEAADKDIQPDWNQNDPEAADYVKNRTHYEVTTRSNAVVEDAVYDCSWDGGNGNSYVVVYDWQPNYIRLSANTAYVVVFDGIEYECTSIQCNNGVAIGNMSLPLDGVSPHEFDYHLIVPDDTGEPFGIFYSNYYTPCVTIYVKDAGEHSISIYELNKQIKKLDKKYLPDDVGSAMYITISENDDGDLIADKTYYEIAEAIKSGITPYCLYGKYVLSLAYSDALSEISTMVGLTP